MITYNELYEALRKEKYSEQLQVLPANFIDQVGEYFREKKGVSDKTEDLFSDLAIKNKKMLENAVVIFKELLLRRRKKILSLAFVASETGIAKKDFDYMLSFEKELFEEVVKSLEKANKNLNNAMEGDKQEQKYGLVRFLENVESFMDVSGESVGPFSKGEIANLEKEIVEILQQDKRVEVID